MATHDDNTTGGDRDGPELMPTGAGNEPSSPEALSTAPTTLESDDSPHGDESSQPAESCPADRADATGDRARSAARRRLYRVIGVLVFAGIVGLGIYYVKRTYFIDTAEMFKRGSTAFAEKDVASARYYAQRILKREPNSPYGALLMGQVLGETGRPDEALAYFSKIPDDATLGAIEARCAAGDILLNKQHRPWDAEQEFQRAYQQDPANPNANQFLGHLMMLGTRVYERIPHEIAMMRYKQFTPSRMIMLSMGETLHTDPTMIEKCAAVVPDDPTVQLGQADIALVEKKYDRAASLLLNVTKSFPQFDVAHVKLGLVHVLTGDDEKFLAWQNGLPEGIERDAGLWYVYGLWAQKLGLQEPAARCFWDAIRRDGTHADACRRLGQLLAELGRTAEGNPFTERADKVEAYRKFLVEMNNAVIQGDTSPQKPLTAASLSFQVGAYWESFGWMGFAQQLDPGNAELKNAFEHMQTVVPTFPRGRLEPRMNPARTLSLSAYDLPEWKLKSANGQVKSDDQPPVDEKQKKPATPPAEAE